MPEFECTLNEQSVAQSLYRQSINFKWKEMTWMSSCDKHDERYNTQHSLLNSRSIYIQFIKLKEIHYAQN